MIFIFTSCIVAILDFTDPFIVKKKIKVYQFMCQSLVESGYTEKILTLGLMNIEVVYIGHCQNHEKGHLNK